MEEVVRDSRESFGHTYAEPLSGLRVSWGSVLAGAVVTLAVALILWTLALAIIALATRPETASLRTSGIALWICAMGTTLVGALVGGWFAGFLPGSPRASLGAAHGFLAWALALVMSFAFQFFVVRGVVMAATNAIAAGTTMMDQSAPGAEGPGAGSPSANMPPPGPTPQDSARAAGREAIDSMVAISWSWFGTWAISLLLAAGAGAAATSRFRGPGFRPGGHLEQHFREERRVGPPLTPAPTT
jgi:hypothetical protein